jgi:hypothetical protein
MWAWVRSGRHLWSGDQASARLRWSTHLVITIALGQLLVYSLLPWGLPVLMVAVGLFWREVLAEEQGERSPVPLLPG